MRYGTLNVTIFGTLFWHFKIDFPTIVNTIGSVDDLLENLAKQKEKLIQIGLRVFRYAKISVKLLKDSGTGMTLSRTSTSTKQSMFSPIVDLHS